MSAIASSAQRVSKKTVSLATRLARLRNGPASFTVPAELKELEMTFSMRNKDYGARKFYKNDLPSILYTNPNLIVRCNRPGKVETPEMLLKYTDGTVKTIHLQAKTDELIREELKEILKGTLPASASQPIFTADNASSPSSPTKAASPTPDAPQKTPPTPPPEGEVESAVDVGTARQ